METDEDVGCDNEKELIDAIQSDKSSDDEEEQSKAQKRLSSKDLKKKRKQEQKKRKREKNHLAAKEKEQKLKEVQSLIEEDIERKMEMDVKQKDSVKEIENRTEENYIDDINMKKNMNDDKIVQQLIEQAETLENGKSLSEKKKRKKKKKKLEVTEDGQLASSCVEDP